MVFRTLRARGGWSRRIRVIARSTLVVWLGRFINARRFERLSMVPLQLRDHLGIYETGKELFRVSGFLSSSDVT